MLHYILIILVIAVIIGWQIRAYRLNRKNRIVFSQVFPSNENGRAYQLSSESSITTNHSNPTWSVIVENINSYLENNKNGVGDFHLMKNIVDRNCDAKEEELDSQVPVPLYLGLMGTMLGIFIGIGYLVASGSLGDLLDKGVTSGGAEGVNTLLGGVALAMGASIVGILLTTIGSARLKKAKVEHEKNKNAFLSWIHARLLPNLPSDTNLVLERVTQNLSNFNQTFSDNVAGLRQTFGMIDNSYSGMSKIIAEVNKLQISEIARANITVYEHLKGCTREIGQFSNYLHSVNDYVRDVKVLTEKIDDAQERTKAIESMGEFFRAEIQQIEERKGYINQAVGSIDSELSRAITQLQENTGKQLHILTEANVKQQQALERHLEDATKIASDTALRQQRELEQRLADNVSMASEATRQQQQTLQQSLEENVRMASEVTRQQQQALQQSLETTAKIASDVALQQQQAIEQHLDETSAIVSELQNLPDVKESISKLERATNEQNRNLERLITKIEKLAEGKIEEISSSRPLAEVQPTMPEWTRIMLIVSGGLVGVVCLVVIGFFLASLFRPLFS